MPEKRLDEVFLPPAFLEALAAARDEAAKLCLQMGEYSDIANARLKDLPNKANY